MQLKMNAMPSVALAVTDENNNASPFQSDDQAARPKMRMKSKKKHELKVASRNISLKKRSVFPLEYTFYHMVTIACVGIALFGVQFNWTKIMGEGSSTTPNYHVGYWCGTFCEVEAIFCLLLSKLNFILVFRHLKRNTEDLF
jgi:hypothetical protein